MSRTCAKLRLSTNDISVHKLTVFIYDIKTNLKFNEHMYIILH